MDAVVAGPDAHRMLAELARNGVQPTGSGAALVWVQLTATDLEGLEGDLVAWWTSARAAADEGTDIVTVVGEPLVDGVDVGHAALGHGLVAATRAWAMERQRQGGVGNVVIASEQTRERAAATVRWLLECRAVSGEVLTAGARRHGRQRL